MLVNVKLDVSWLQTLLVFLYLNGMAKMKLAIFPFLCGGEIVKNYWLGAAAVNSGSLNPTDLAMICWVPDDL